jgi:hypothetical protein
VNITSISQTELGVQVVVEVRHPSGKVLDKVITKKHKSWDRIVASGELVKKEVTSTRGIAVEGNLVSVDQRVLCGGLAQLQFSFKRKGK